MGLERLLEETPESYYWSGLIMADGYISNKRGGKCVIVQLSEKDKTHIEKLSKFVDVPLKLKTARWTYNGISKSSKHYRLEKWDENNTLAISNKFNMLEKKTYNPPSSLNIEDNNLFVAFILGFIDGDGCIDKQGCLHVQCHASWRECLEGWFNRLYDIVKPNLLNKVQKNVVKANIDKRDGGVRVEIYNNEILVYLRNKAIEMNLPTMKRKWERIVERKKYSRDSFELKEEIKKLLNSGIKQKEISIRLGINNSYVSYIKNGERR
jgi:hypothetical protein